MTPEFSVIVPVKDGGRYLAELLQAVHDQGEDVEVLVIDSGSRDDSVAIARAAGAEVLEITPEEFGHGRTRNLGAERTHGQLIAFLTQDATPAPGWLAAYREAFALSERVGAAYGPHLPRADTSPMIARELVEFFAGFSPDGQPVVQRQGDPNFLANVNACYWRDCWEQIRFPDVAYSEDQAFGRAMLEAGWEKVYHPGAAVYHAHDYGAATFMRRYFDEYRGLRQTLGHVEGFGLRSSARIVRASVARDRQWMIEQGMPPANRKRWIVRSTVHHGGRRVFSALGSRADRVPQRVQRSISLEGAAVAEFDEVSGPPVTVPVPARGPSVFEEIRRVAVEGPAPLLEPVSGMSERTPLHVAVVIPPFRRGSGGHNSIFQMLSRLERAGHSVSIWLHDPMNWQRDEWPAVIRANIREFFAPLEAPVFRGFDHWYGADVVVATGWQTVHPALLLDNVRARAYLVHDHENEFYATSAESWWAEQTYSLGLHPIAASPWLAELMARRYGTPASEFDFGVDHDIYHPRAGSRRRDTIMFYARDVTPRRAVPLGVLALQELHRRRPNVRLVLFGDLEEMDAPFPYEHLGIASPEQLARAYSEATAGLVLSMTNYSLIPQEMLACGLPCVDLAGFSAETVFGADGPVELAPFDPVAIADALERLLDDQALWERRSQDGRHFVADRTWDRAAGQLEAGLRTALREREQAGTGVTREGAPTGVATPPARGVVSRAVPVEIFGARPTTERLLARLEPEDIAAVEAALDTDTAPWFATAGPENRGELTLALGVYHRVPAVLEKTGLRPDEPPEHVHAMARGPLASGGGFYEGDMIVEALELAGGSMDSVRRALDFGCSSGRAVRVLAAAFEDVEWLGVDPNVDAIAWAREHLPEARFDVSPGDPPLALDDGSLDLVFAISIWSHFGETAALRWLDEMHRLLAPGGHLVLTTHGPQSIAYYGQIGARPPHQLEQIRSELYRRGFWYAPEFGEAGDFGVKHAEWGTAFLTPEWLLRHVTGRWDVAHYAVGRNTGNQDVIVLRRKALSTITAP
jgi:glycosyltransferase involved in cell wall biosynthesis/SAM-dependent methyltransferase